jgi:hypothetical protein
MFSSVILLELIALLFLFLLASVWSEENVRFGYVLVPLMAAFFWWAGFLPFAYLTTVIPLMIFMGVISFMRAQLKVKWGFFGTGGGILYKIVFFLIMVQLAIGYVNGLGMFAGDMGIAPSNEYTTYNLDSANSSFGQQSYGIDAIDVISNGLQMAWAMFKVLWTMLAAVFLIYPTLVGVFGIPPSLSVLLQCGIYVIYALELVNMVYKPYKVAEV